MKPETKEWLKKNAVLLAVVAFFVMLLIYNQYMKINYAKIKEKWLADVRRQSDENWEYYANPENENITATNSVAFWGNPPHYMPDYKVINEWMDGAAQGGQNSGYYQKITPEKLKEFKGWNWLIPITDIHRRTEQMRVMKSVYKPAFVKNWAEYWSWRFDENLKLDPSKNQFLSDPDFVAKYLS